MIGLGRAAAVALSTIALLLCGLFGASYLVSALLDLPTHLGLPLAMRIAGGLLAVLGLSLAGWTFRHRRPSAMLLSTYVTLEKLFRRRPISDPLGRAEPLVVSGLQRYTRNPLYLGVITMTLGWALAGDLTFVLIAVIALVLWFRAVLIPFEEKELLALFGEQYEKYRDGVPMLVPFTKRKRRTKNR